MNHSIANQNFYMQQTALRERGVGGSVTNNSQTQGLQDQIVHHHHHHHHHHPGGPTAAAATTTNSRFIIPNTNHISTTSSQQAYPVTYSRRIAEITNGTTTNNNNNPTLPSQSNNNNNHNNNSQQQQQQQQQTIPTEISSRCSSTSNYSYADSGTYTSSPNISPTQDTSSQNTQIQIEPDRPIGYGAFGVVWAVTDPRDRQRVALKKMPYVFNNLVSAKRVYRELKILASIKHDNILKALDILLPPEDLREFTEVYVVTDLLQSDLHKIIVSSQTLTTDHVTIFIYQLLRGLKFLHALGIIHRDIKPGNLLVNSNCLLKICDFGLSREYTAVLNPHTVSILTSDSVDNSEGFCYMTQEVITQYYRPPELLMGASKYNLAIDIWSVGCILVELITRRILFQAPSPLAQLDVMCSILGSPREGEKSLFLGCKSARLHVLTKTAISKSFGLRSNIIGHNPMTPPGLLYLAEEMLDWDPRKRPTVFSSLKNPCFDDARIRFHTCMCTCCPRLSSSNNNQAHPPPPPTPSSSSTTSSNSSTDSHTILKSTVSWSQQQAHQQQIQHFSRTHENLFEPLPQKPFNFDNYLNTLTSLDHVKFGMATWIKSQPCGKRLPLCINLNSPTFKQFQQSTVAQSNELPPSPEKWKS